MTPASGDNIIIMTENEKDSAEVSVARCSEGNISCRIAFVRTCIASSPIAAKKPPNVITGHIDECSAKTPVNTSSIVITNTLLYFSFGNCKISFDPIMPPISINSRAKPSHP